MDRARTVNGSNPRGAVNASVHHPLVRITSGRGSLLRGGRYARRLFYEILSRKVYTSRRLRRFLLLSPLMRPFALRGNKIYLGLVLHQSRELARKFTSQLFRDRTEND